MRKLLVWPVLVSSIVSLVGCRGESPTLPPPPPPEPAYKINLYGDIHADSVEGNTSFVVTFEPRLGSLQDVVFTMENGVVKNYILDPWWEGQTPPQYTSVIVFATVRPGSKLTIKAGRSEKTFDFPVKSVPKCRWREIPRMVYYKFETDKEDIREAARWGMFIFWNSLTGTNFIEGDGRPLFIFRETSDTPNAGVQCDVCPIYLKDGEKWSAAHEIGHSLGLYHASDAEGPRSLMCGVWSGGPPECFCSQILNPFTWFVSPSRLN